MTERVGDFRPGRRHRARYSEPFSSQGEEICQEHADHSANVDRNVFRLAKNATSIVQLTDADGVDVYVRPSMVSLIERADAQKGTWSAYVLDAGEVILDGEGLAKLLSNMNVV